MHIILCILKFMFYSLQKKCYLLEQENVESLEEEGIDKEMTKYLFRNDKIYN